MATAERPWALGIVLAAYAVMWVGGVATLWRGTAAPSWAAPLFLLLAAAAAALAGGRGAWVAVALFGAGGFLAELVGVHAGFPFGAYRYTAALAPSLESVPLAIACAWIVLLSFARDLAWRWTRRPAVAVLAGAAAMTAFDLLLDPVAAGPLGYWRWLHGGPATLEFRRLVRGERRAARSRGQAARHIGRDRGRRLERGRVFRDCRLASRRLAIAGFSTAGRRPF